MLVFKTEVHTHRARQDDTLTFISEKKRLDISCDSSAGAIAQRFKN